MLYKTIVKFNYQISINPIVEKIQCHDFYSILKGILKPKHSRRLASTTTVPFCLCDVKCDVGILWP